MMFLDVFLGCSATYRLNRMLAPKFLCALVKTLSQGAGTESKAAWGLSREGGNSGNPSDRIIFSNGATPKVSNASKIMCTKIGTFKFVLLLSLSL